MADQDAKDTAAKERIITHMNNDHHDSIIRYLENYKGLSTWTASTGHIASIDLHTLELTCAGQTHRLSFSPALGSYREARERLVAMDKQCLQALGRSEITVREFVAPRGFDRVVLLAVLATFLGYSQRWWFGEGGMVARTFGTGFARFSWVVQPWLLSLMVAIHFGELCYFAQRRLRRHSVNPRGMVWWLWAGSVFLEGVFAFRRFDELVGRKQAEKEKQKH